MCLVSIMHMLKIIGFDIDNQVDFCINGKQALETVKFGY